jgi:hypothetical protein
MGLLMNYDGERQYHVALGFEDFAEGFLFHSALLISYSRHSLNLEWSRLLLASPYYGPICKELACQGYTDGNSVEVRPKPFESFNYVENESHLVRIGCNITKREALSAPSQPLVVVNLAYRSHHVPLPLDGESETLRYAFHSSNGSTSNHLNNRRKPYKAFFAMG